MSQDSDAFLEYATNCKKKNKVAYEFENYLTIWGNLPPFPQWHGASELGKRLEGTTTASLIWVQFDQFKYTKDRDSTVYPLIVFHLPSSLLEGWWFEQTHAFTECYVRTYLITLLDGCLKNYTTLWNILTYQLLCKKNYTTCVKLYTSCVIFLTQQLVGSYVSQCCVIF